MNSKFESLKARLRNLSSVAIAFSSGVDSALLTRVGSMILPSESVLAVTFRMPGTDEEDVMEAKNFCKAYRIKHQIKNLNLLDNREFRANREDRCFLCKQAMYESLRKIADTAGIKHIADGSIVEDIEAERPARIAQLEYSVVTPLADSGYDKKSVRELAQRLELPVANKPAFSCYVSRIPYGFEITRRKIEKIKAAERILRLAGFSQARVVDREETLIIELPPAFKNSPENIETLNSIEEVLKSIGYLKINVDFKRFKEEK